MPCRHACAVVVGSNLKALRCWHCRPRCVRAMRHCAQLAWTSSLRPFERLRQMRVITTTGMIMTKMSWLMTILVIDLIPLKPKRLRLVMLAKRKLQSTMTIGNRAVRMRIRRRFQEPFARMAERGAGPPFALALLRRKLKHAPGLTQPA